MREHRSDTPRSGTPRSVADRSDTGRMAGSRGALRVFLGAAPGVGKTYAMLDEAHRRADRGTDLVVGVVEDHDRRQTRARVAGLEVVPRRIVDHRGTTLTELDVDAVLARRPEAVLVDELAHTNAPGSRHPKRWQDVEELLDAGIDVVTTINVQHLESLNDVVRAITGVEQRETVPDGIVRAAEAIELVDMSPDALRRRIAHGNVYAADKVDAALSRYFRTGNLTALRELALLWVADRVDDALQRYRADHDIGSAWPARERVVVALTGGRAGETLIRNAARVVGRAVGGDLLAVYVARGDGIAGSSPADLVRQRHLVESLGGTFQTVTGEDVAAAILSFARGVNATQIVLGMSRRSRLSALLTRGVGEAVIDGSGDIDVHVVTHVASRSVGPWRRRRTRRSSPLGSRRRAAGWVAALALPVVLTVILGSAVAPVDLSLHLMLFLAATVVVALVGGFLPALLCAVAGGLLVDVFFTEPRGSLTVASWPVAVAVAVSVGLGAAVAWVVDAAARRSQQAADSEAEARALAVMTSTMIRSPNALDALLHQVADTFGMTSVTLLERAAEPAPPDGGTQRAASRGEVDGQWSVRASVGSQPCTRPDDGDIRVPVTADMALVARSAPSRPLRARDRRLLEAFAAQASTVLEARRLQREAGRARRAADGNALRTALLAGVSHDLRTPLAAIKAAVSSLRQPDVVYDKADTAELLAGIEAGTDRLDGVVGNLLDMTRLQMGDLTVHRERVDLGDVVDRARLSMATPSIPPGEPGAIDASGVGEDAPRAVADAGLLERVVANLLENAHLHAPGAPVSVRASTAAGRVELRIADRGPGLSAARQQEMFAPFTRVGDTPPPGGVGLGLAVARGLVEAMSGTLTTEDTPGGGLTLVVDLPAADSPAEVRAEGPAEVPAEVRAEVPAEIPADLVRVGHDPALPPARPPLVGRR